MKALFTRTFLFLLMTLVAAILATSQVSADAGPPPLSAANIRFDDEVLTVEVEGDYAYVGLASGMAILDIMHPTQPVILGMIDERTITIAVDKDVVYKSGGGPLEVIDVSNPLRPTRLFEGSAGGDVEDLAVRGQYLYVATSRDLNVLDVSEPKTPRIIGAVENRGHMFALDLAEDPATDRVYVYMTSGIIRGPGVGDDNIGGGLRVIDVTNPADPQEVWPCSNDDPCPNSDGPADITVDGSYAYVSYWTDATAQERTGLVVWDISLPQAPHAISNYRTEEPARRVAMAGDRAYIVEDEPSLDLAAVCTVLKLWIRCNLAASSAQLEGRGGITASAGKGCVFASERAKGLKILCETHVTPTPPPLVWLPLVATPTS